jgi:hypothetical protein
MMTQRLSKTGFRNAGRLALIGVGIAAAIAMPLSASAHGHGHGNHGGDYDGGYRGGYHGDDHGNRGYWNGGSWIAGAIVTGAVLGLVNDALRPAPVYYDAPVVYSQRRRVIYRDDPDVVVRRRVIERHTVVYDDPYETRYIRDDRDYGDDDD